MTRAASSRPVRGRIESGVQAGVVSAVLALPRRVQRRLAGRPIVLDGQTLDTQVQLVLRLQRLARVPVPDQLGPVGGRRLLDDQAVVMGGDQPVGVVIDRTVAGLPARVYVPTALATSSDPRPTMVFFHGGGFFCGGLESHDAACRLLARESGVQVIAVDYRLAPEDPFPAAYDDAVAAFRWVVEHAEELRVDTARLAVGGDSAGGNLSAGVALHAARERLPLAFQLLIYPATDLGSPSLSRRLFASGFYLTQSFMDLANDCYVPDVATREDPRVAPLRADIPPGVAPAHIVTAGFDPLRDEGEAYGRKLQDAGVAVEVRRHEGLIHGFLNWVERGDAVRNANHELAAALATGVKAR
ncbi:MAG: alpha/beta hydrolase [Nocardioides sp.]